jgi:putrescine transport system substrate-binding protein
MKFSRFQFANALAVLLVVLGSGSGIAAAAAEEKRLFVYNWSDFIGSNTIAEFEQQTGIIVTYDVYDSEESMDARLLAGSSGYDVVIASTEYFGREIKAGVYTPLDRSKLPNWKNLDPRILAIQAVHDPGNLHSVPYMHAINGFAYNVDMIKARMPDAPVDSLDMIFKPEIAAKFADCGITFLDSALRCRRRGPTKISRPCSCLRARLIHRPPINSSISCCGRT